MFRKSLALALVATFVMPLAGCNTVRGAGEDIESVGDAAAGHCATRIVWRNHHRVRVCR